MVGLALSNENNWIVSLLPTLSQAENALKTNIFILLYLSVGGKVLINALKVP